MGSEQMATDVRRVTLTPTVVRQTLYYFGDTNLGEDGGHFVTRLFALTAAADEDNRGKLATLWPEHVTAFNIAARMGWGLDYLRGLAKAHELHAENMLDMGGAA